MRKSTKTIAARGTAFFLSVLLCIGCVSTNWLGMAPGSSDGVTAQMEAHAATFSAGTYYDVGVMRVKVADGATGYAAKAPDIVNATSYLAADSNTVTLFSTCDLSKVESGISFMGHERSGKADYRAAFPDGEEEYFYLAKGTASEAAGITSISWSIKAWPKTNVDSTGAASNLADGKSMDDAKALFEDTSYFDRYDPKWVSGEQDGTKWGTGNYSDRDANTQDPAFRYGSKALIWSGAGGTDTQLWSVINTEPVHWQVTGFTGDPGNIGSIAATQAADGYMRLRIGSIGVGNPMSTTSDPADWTSGILTKIDVKVSDTVNEKGVKGLLKTGIFGSGVAASETFLSYLNNNKPKSGDASMTWGLLSYDTMALMNVAYADTKQGVFARINGLKDGDHVGLADPTGKVSGFDVTDKTLSNLNAAHTYGVRVYGIQTDVYAKPYEIWYGMQDDGNATMTVYRNQAACNTDAGTTGNLAGERTGGNPWSAGAYRYDGIVVKNTGDVNKIDDSGTNVAGDGVFGKTSWAHAYTRTGMNSYAPSSFVWTPSDDMTVSETGGSSTIKTQSSVSDALRNTVLFKRYTKLGYPTQTTDAFVLGGLDPTSGTLLNTQIPFEIRNQIYFDFTDDAQRVSGTLSGTGSTPPAAPSGDLANMTIQKLVNGRTLCDANPGEVVTFTIMVYNNGNEDLEGVNIVDPLANMDFKSAVLAVDGLEPVNFTGQPSGGTYSVGTLLKGKQALLTIEATMHAVSGTITNTATATTTTKQKPVDATGKPLPEVAIRPSSAVNIRVRALPPGLLISNQSTKYVVGLEEIYTYTVTVRNTGLVDINNIVLTAPLPSNVEFVSATKRVGNTTEDIAPWTGTENIGTIGTNGSVQYEVKVKSKSEGAAVNFNAAAAGSDGTGALYNINAGVDVEIRRAAVTTILHEKGVARVSGSAVPNVPVTANVKLADTISYTGLVQGEQYTVRTKVIDKDTGKTFKAGDVESVWEDNLTCMSAAGTMTFDFEITFTNMQSELSGKTAVAFNELIRKSDGYVVASEADKNNNNQTVIFGSGSGSVEDDRPIRTIASGAGGAKIIKAAPDTKIMDTITYKGLEKDKVYTVRTELYDLEAGAIIDTIAPVMTELKPSDTTGSATFVISLDTSSMKGKKIVVYETIYLGTSVVMSHKDPNDTDQTVTVEGGRVKAGSVTIDTFAMDSRTGSHTLGMGDGASIRDQVYYTGLVEGQEYQLRTTLYNKKTGLAVNIAGNPATPTVGMPGTGQQSSAPVNGGIVNGGPSSVSGGMGMVGTFVAAKGGKGVVEVDIPVNMALYQDGATLVVAEEILEEDVVLAAHKDLGDLDQTVYVAAIGTVLTDKNGGKTVRAGNTVLIRDTVTFTNLEPGRAYTVNGYIIDTTGPAEDPEQLVVTKQGSGGSSGSGSGNNGSGSDNSGSGSSNGNNGSNGDTNGTFNSNWAAGSYGNTNNSANNAGTAQQNKTEEITIDEGRRKAASGSTLMLADGSKLDFPGELIATGTATFTPTAATGTIGVDFTTSTARRNGHNLVCVEIISLDGVVVAKHADMSDLNQTVTVRTSVNVQTGGSPFGLAATAGSVAMMLFFGIYTVMAIVNRKKFDE